MFACFQPNIWVGPVLPSVHMRLHTGEHEKETWRGEVRFWLVFSPKPQVTNRPSAWTMQKAQMIIKPSTLREVRN
jgi:hypothetical protein